MAKMTPEDKAEMLQLLNDENPEVVNDTVVRCTRCNEVIFTDGGEFRYDRNWKIVDVICSTCCWS